VRSIDDDYLELLRTGSSSGEERKLEVEVGDWLMLVAEPWWDGIRARARSGTGSGSSSTRAGTTTGSGSLRRRCCCARTAPAIPPEVTMWKWPFTRRQDRKRERAFLADWGDLLVNARASAAGG
jgi:hypothetical protein